MESIAQIGFGMILSYSDTSGGSYTPLVDLIEIKPAGWKVPGFDATHHTSPDTAEEQRPALVQYQELECQVSWSKTQYPSFGSLKRLVKYWKVTYPDGSFEIFPGWISDLTPATPLKDRMTTSLKIMPTGKSVFTAAS